MLLERQHDSPHQHRRSTTAVVLVDVLDHEEELIHHGRVSDLSRTWNFTLGGLNRQERFRQVTYTTLPQYGHTVIVLGNAHTDVRMFVTELRFG
ncbi:hypothetical protein D3C87_1930580 [compost metagenome]